MKTRKASNLIEEPYSPISSYCKAGNKTDPSHLFKSFPEIFRHICVTAECFRNAAKNDFDIADDQNAKDKLNSLDASQEGLGGLSLYDLFQGKSCMILPLCSNR